MLMDWLASLSVLEQRMLLPPFLQVLTGQMADQYQKLGTTHKFDII